MSLLVYRVPNSIIGTILEHDIDAIVPYRVSLSVGMSDATH